ncbi:adenylyl-sulfate kinase [Holophaga foetida]|uniref:adenylyl-sulfate kinase n=1 Tax=Holophaga foetida TaxID=35839 RepID=UPI0002473AD3|nr:adenylyl-sulfate kinase [Holophaga foetida]
METQEKSILRVVTSGSVDDGKSTLIGRMLYETRSIFEDQLEAVKRTSERRGQQEVDLALLLDGLSAEREQGITIDVAYRYFETPTRKYILADCPGHVQYTRNMVTGASSADCAILLIDARNGILTQSRRHAFLVSLLRVPRMVVVINKMDQVGFSREVFERLVAEYRAFVERLDLPDITFIPVSALRGDNVVMRSAAMPWYGGPSLLQHLEALPTTHTRNLVDFRFPVQSVLRPNQDFRGYAGRIASGAIRPGEPVLVLPSRVESRIKEVLLAEKSLEEGIAGQSVVLTLEDNVDVSRGDMLVRPHNLPLQTKRFEAVLSWMGEAPLETGCAYLLRHGTRNVKAVVTRVYHAIDVDTLRRTPAETLDLNGIGKVEVELASPLACDPFKANRATGSFILVDAMTHCTAAAGLILGTAGTLESLEPAALPEASPNTVWSPWNIPRGARERQAGHPGQVLWFTGLSGSGKSTLARALERRLFERGQRTMLLDGDQVRHGLCRDLGFSPEDRSENIRRVGEVARLFFEAGHIVLCTFISPYAEDRDTVRGLIPQGRFHEVHVDASVETCTRRDPNGLYAKALRGEIPQFTGISAPYEQPGSPELRLETDNVTPEALLAQLEAYLRCCGLKI